MSATRAALGTRRAPRAPRAPRVAVGVVTLVTASCGGMLRGASFSGTSYPPIVTASSVQDLDVAPPDHDVIGSVEAQCTSRSGEKEIAMILLSDLTCSESMLASDLARKAAAEGGAALVGRRCEESSRDEKQTRKKDGKEETYTVTLTERTCRADVSRPRTPPPPVLARSEPVGPPVVAGSASSASLREPRVADETRAKAKAEEVAPARRVSVRVTPVKGAPLPPFRRATPAEEVATRPEEHADVAEIFATCERGCDEGGVRAGLREAAAGIGASHIVGTRCAVDGDRISCTGMATAAPRR